MKILQFEVIVIITTQLINFTVSEDLEIFRVRANGSDGWTKGTDKFKLPPSLCGAGRNDSVNCARFGANVKSENGQMCLCACPNENATVMYQNREWRCLKNSVVRDLLGYDARTYIYFDNENKDSELRMLNISDNRRVSLSWRLSQCRVHEESSLAIGCNGSKVSFNTTLFTIERRGFRNFLKVNSPSHSEPIEGRNIQLGIRCVTRFLGYPIYRRLLFKYEGKLTCSISIPTVQPSVTTRPQTTSTLSPTTKATRTTSVATNGFTPITSHIIPNDPTTASDAVSNTSPTGSDFRPTVSVTPPTIFEVHPTVSDSPPTFTQVQPTVSDFPSITYGVHPTLSEIQPTTSNTPSTTSVTTTLSSSNVNAPSRPNPGSEQRTEKRSSSLALIAPVLAIVVIVGFLVYRRRYAKPKSYSSTRFEGMKEPGDESVIYKELDFKEQQLQRATLMTTI